jgi:hypothetical protein
MHKKLVKTFKKPSPASQVQPDIVCETNSDNGSPFPIPSAPKLIKSVEKK